MRLLLSEPDGDSPRLCADADDATLGAMVAEGDGAALAALYDRHGGTCYGLARRIVVDGQLAEDVVQEVFLAVWRGAGRYDGGRGSVASWLLALTHHKAVDAVRRSQRHASRRADVSALDPLADPDTNVEESAVRRLRADRVRSALADLPEAQREVLVFAYFGGHTQAEIARLVDAPLGTVKTRTLAALRRMQSALAATERAQGGEP